MLRRTPRRGATPLRRPLRERLAESGRELRAQRRADAPVNQSVAPTPPLATRLRSWLLDHLRALVASLGHLARNPLSALMTAAVIGIALALPAALYILIDNLGRVSHGWDGESRISVYLRPDLSDESGERLATRLRGRPEVAMVEMVGREQALDEFKRLSGFGEAIALLDENPLPVVLVVTPTPRNDTPSGVEMLEKSLRLIPEVDLVQLDLAWVKRLHAMMETARQGVVVISGLLALTVLLVVGNTIRLDIQNRRDEIVITKLIGGTDAFIRRPFLYGGFWYGAIGGVIAWLLVAISYQMLAGGVERLIALYESRFEPSVLTFSNSSALLAIAIALGLGGSWLAVGRHLRQIEPV